MEPDTFNEFALSLVKAALRHGDTRILSAENLIRKYADAAHVITCPEGACRYFEGNRRAKKRVERTQWIIGSIGLEEERIGITVRSKDDRRSLAELAKMILEMTSKLGPSPVHHPQSSSSSSSSL